MRHFIIFFSLVWLVSCNTTTGNQAKQYNFGAYTFTQSGILSNMYSCPILYPDEADELFKLFFNDSYEHGDYKDRKFFQKYGLIISPWDIVGPSENKYDDFKYHVEVFIYTVEEYEQLNKQSQQREYEKNIRIKSIQ